MTIQDAPIDWLAVILAALLNLLISAVWYSKWLFKDVWRQYVKGKRRAVSFLFEGITSLLTAYFLAFFEIHLGITTVSDGMFVGFCMWLGFAATTQLFPLIWEKEAMALFFLRAGQRLLSFLVMGGILGA